MSKKSLHLKISGDVQGVTFRYQAQEIAEKLELVGWIHNNPDGTVDCEVLGEEDALKKFLEWARRGPRWAKVEEIEEEWGEYRNGFDGFEIRY